MTQGGCGAPFVSCRGNDDDDDGVRGGGIVTPLCPPSTGRLDEIDSGFAQFVRPHRGRKENGLVLSLKCLTAGNAAPRLSVAPFLYNR